MRIGVVGNRDFKNPDLISEKLNQFYEIFRLSKEFIVVSGEAPNKKGSDGKGNVDQLAKKWALKMKAVYKNVGYIPFPPEKYIEEEFKKRNKQIANKNNLCLAFINKGRYHSGTWNTIKHMTEKIWFSTFMIFNENDEEWTFEEYPSWLKKRLSDKPYLLKIIQEHFNTLTKYI